MHATPLFALVVRHVGRCEHGHIWIYSLGKGWRKPSEKALKSIRSARPDTTIYFPPGVDDEGWR